MISFVRHFHVQVETYKIMKSSEIIHGFSKERGNCKFKTNKRRYSFIGYIKMRTIETALHKTECINGFKKEGEYKFAGVY